MEKVFATPKEGVRVRKENGELLDPAGEAVERTSFWLRRERDGDVVLTKTAAITVEEPATPAVTEEPATPAVTEEPATPAVAEKPATPAKKTKS